MKRKLICVIASAILALSMSACGNSNTPANNNGSDNTSTDTPAVSSDTEESAVEQANNGASSDKIQITYANWNLGTEEENNIERQMISEFNKNSATTEVVPAQNVDYSDYATSLNTLAASGSLPDIIMLENIPQPYANKWLADITDIAQSDSEWADISQNLVESAVVNGKIVAVPFAMHMFGAIINVNAFEKANVEVPQYGITLDDFEASLKAVNQPQNGVVAIKYEGDMINWLPSVLNKDYGYFTFDGSKFNLDSNEVMTSLRKINEYRSNGLTFNSLSENQLMNFIGTNDWEAYTNGETAVNFDGTWSITGAINEFNLDVQFMGLPNSRSVIVSDYFAITPTCQNMQEAFDFMKWMSYGVDGFSKRIDLAVENGTAYFSMPISGNAELLEKFTSYMTVPGIKEAYADIDTAVIEAVKVIPGYSDVRWEAQTGLSIPGEDGTIENANMYQIISEASMRGLNYADYAQRINDLANEKYNEAKNAME